MHGSKWMEALLDYDRSDLEFTGDDVDQFSALVDLGKQYKQLAVMIPALAASGTVSVYVQRDGNIDTIPLVVHALDADTTGSFLHATSSGAGSIAVIFDIAGAQFVRVRVNANQTANRSFVVRGLDEVMPGT